MERYKVWIEVEKVDEEKDIYEDVDVDIPSAGTFNDVQEATRFAHDLFDMAQDIVGEYDSVDS